MALITCHECQGPVSTEAVACPRCGAPPRPQAAAPAAPVSPRKPQADSGLAWAIGGVAAIVVFIVLVSSGMDQGASAPGTSSPAEDFRHADADTSVPVPPPGPVTGWHVSTGVSEMDGSPTVSLSLSAEGEIQGWMESRTPMLYIRCRENKTDVYVVTGMQANPEYGLFNEASVRVRLDDRPPTRQRWGESTSGDALFAPRPIAFARDLARAERLSFEFTPFNSSPQTVHFQLEGLSPLLPQVADACGWSV